MNINKKYGSATRLNGKTVIISIFIDDLTTNWNYGDTSELNRMYDTIDNLRIATEWIRKNASRFGARPEFIYDWSKDYTLFARIKSDKNLIRINENSENHYYDLCKYIDKYIDSEKIKRTYHTDSLLYMFFYDTAPFLKARSYAFQYEVGYPYVYETCHIFCRTFGGVSGPGVYAHEILHAFGAPDLYYANKKIPQRYVDYLKKIGSKDVMYSNDPLCAGKVNAVFTDVDAYYTGLISICPDVAKWGLGKSMYQ